MTRRLFGLHPTVLVLASTHFLVDVRVQLSAAIPDHPLPTAGFDHCTDIRETGPLVKRRAAGHQQE